MRGDEALWHIGGLGFSPTLFLVPVLLAPVVWGLSEVCVRIRWARVPIALIPIGIGAWCAHGALSAVSGYVAGYAFFIVWAFAVLIGTSGILLLIVQRTRRAGVLGIGASVVLLASFYLVFFVGRSMGVNEWPGDRLISIPPVAPK